MTIYKSHGDGNFKASQFKKIGEAVIFEKGIKVWHPENIEIGNNVYIGHDTHIKGYYNNKLLIGNNVWIGQQCFLHAGGGIKIGDYVGIGPGVKILTLQHINLENTEKPIIEHEQKYEMVTIEDNVDIGIGAIILPGITIGKGSVIGAGSVVTKDVAPCSIVAGNPARLLRK
jgi:acetyltransferase-like isoleucine patch superfamily enzyme